jgi:hypothetical protein
LWSKAIPPPPSTSSPFLLWHRIDINVQYIKSVHKGRDEGMGEFSFGLEISMQEKRFQGPLWGGRHLPISRRLCQTL